MPLDLYILSVDFAIRLIRRSLVSQKIEEGTLSSKELYTNSFKCEKQSVITIFLERLLNKNFGLRS